ncbi:MAG: leucine-rich repeat domain-containing protein [Promethearchaeota archaeon]
MRKNRGKKRSVFLNTAPSNKMIMGTSTKYQSAQPNKPGHDWWFVNRLFTAWQDNLPPITYGYTAKGRNLLFHSHESSILEDFLEIKLITFYNNHTAPSETLLELISQIPGKLPDLTGLRLKYDFLPTIPSSFENFSRIKKLVIGGKQLSALPDDFFDRYFPSLISLGIYDCPITSIPLSITHLKNLAFLDIRYCPNLTTLPDGFGGWPNLYGVHLEFLNNLTSIPLHLVEGENLKDFRYIGYTDHVVFPPLLQDYVRKPHRATNRFKNKNFKFIMVDFNEPGDKFWDSPMWSH